MMSRISEEGGEVLSELEGAEGKIASYEDFSKAVEKGKFDEALAWLDEQREAKSLKGKGLEQRAINHIEDLFFKDCCDAGEWGTAIKVTESPLCALDPIFVFSKRARIEKLRRISDSSKEDIPELKGLADVERPTIEAKTETEEKVDFKIEDTDSFRRALLLGQFKEARAWLDKLKKDDVKLGDEEWFKSWEGELDWMEEGSKE